MTEPNEKRASVARPMMRRIIVVVALGVLIVALVSSFVKEETAPISERGAKELEEAISIVESPIPVPSYLPSGYEIQGILRPNKGNYYVDDHGIKRFWQVTLIISDEEVEGPVTPSMLEWINYEVGLFEVAGERAIQLDLVLWEGYPLSLETYTGAHYPEEYQAPAPTELFDGVKGYFHTIDGCYLVMWSLPGWDESEFALRMVSSREVPIEEFINIAKSIKLPN